ncbi:hypothetical protein [Enterococcus sp. AZ196]|uniref:hypothetical protein n=1 Tax=Enterococcus sp. AZ196 TaxID=2774659 RepID=UPI003D29F5C1
MKRNKQKKAQEKKIPEKKSALFCLRNKIILRNNQTVIFLSRQKFARFIRLLLACILIGTALIFYFDQKFFSRNLIELRQSFLEKDEDNQKKQVEYLDDFAEIYVVDKDEAPSDPKFLNKVPRWNREIYNKITTATTNYTKEYHIESYTNGDRYDDLIKKVGTPHQINKNDDEDGFTTYHALWSETSNYSDLDCFYVYIEIEYEAQGNQIISKTFRGGKYEDDY